MHKYWYACSDWNTPNEVLWKHEWEKHGTCIVGVTPREYFKHTLEAFMDAEHQNFFGCCSNNEKECLLPYSRNITIVKWLGKC